MAEPRYVTAGYLAGQIGFSARWLTSLAAREEIPGAHQPGGAGGHWRFDERMFFEWWHKGRAKGAKWHPSTGAAGNGGAGYSAPGRSTDSPLRRRLRELRENA